MKMWDIIMVIGMLSSAVGAYVAAMTRTKLRLQHLEDTKADRAELTEIAVSLKEGIHSLDRKITEIDTKISVLLISGKSKSSPRT